MSEPVPPLPPRLPARRGAPTPVVLGLVGLGVVAIAVTWGLALRPAAPDRPVTPDELASAFAQEFPDGVPSGGADPHDGDIQEYLVDRPASAHLIPGTPAEQRLDPATAAKLLDPSVAFPSGFRDGYARAWIDDQDNHVTVEVYRFEHADQARDLAGQLAAWYRATLGSSSVAPADYDSGATLIGRSKDKTGLIPTVGIGQVGDITTVIVADQPTLARPETLDSLLEKERVDL